MMYFEMSKKKWSQRGIADDTKLVLSALELLPLGECFYLQEEGEQVSSLAAWESGMTVFRKAMPPIVADKPGW